MALHEIELSKGYEIKWDTFFDENKFKNLIKHNNLVCKNEDKIFLEKHHIKTEYNSFLHNKYNFVLNSNFKSLNDVILNPINLNQNPSNYICLYSSWFLFYLALNKSNSGKAYKDDFFLHIDDFKFMEEYLLKKYYIFFCNRNSEKIKDIENKLNYSLKTYIKNTYKDEKPIVTFLKFLLKLHKVFFNNEQYKVMWNLESVYIYEIIEILINTYSLEYKDVIEKINYKMGVGISQIDSIYIELSKHIYDNKVYIISNDLRLNINNLFNIDLNVEELFSILYKEEYFEIYNSIIELQKRMFSSNKINNNLCLAILMGLVLSLEPKIKSSSKVESNELLVHLKSFDCLNKCVLGTYQYNEKKVFFDKLNILIKEQESIEKYLMIYRNSRNYLAHGKVDFFRLLEEDHIKNIINSMLITIKIIQNKSQHFSQTQSIKHAIKTILNCS